MDAYEVIEDLLSCHEDHVGTYINRYADEFRRGADLRDLRPLLTHPDPRVVGVGAWIVSEVANPMRGREVFRELYSLASHADPSVRFDVIKSLTWLVRPEETNVTRLLLRRLDDDDSGVRRIALAYVCLLPDVVVEGMRDTSDWETVQVLVAGARKDQVRKLLLASARFEQRLAVAGAMRNYGDEQSFINELAPLFDQEVREILNTLPRHRSFRRVLRDTATPEKRVGSD